MYKWLKNIPVSWPSQRDCGVCGECCGLVEWSGDQDDEIVPASLQPDRGEKGGRGDRRGR